MLGIVRALIRRGTPARWVLTDVPEPVRGPAEVLIDVVTAGLNRADLLMREGNYTPTDWTVPADRVGFELAGRVVAAPAGAGFAPGDRVLAQTGGACAERVAVDHRLVLPVPARLGWPEAAGLPSALLTEFDALVMRAGLVQGERVLVLGATSGVGLVGVQLARELGASVVAGTTRSPGKAELLRSLGITPLVGPLCTEERFDVVLDHVGGSALADALSVAATGARIVQIGRLGGRQATLDLELLAARRLRLIGTTFRGRSAAESHELTARVRDVLPSSAVRPVVDAVFAFADAEQAAERLRAPDVAGKVVLSIGSGR